MKRYFVIIVVLAITFISINDANAQNSLFGVDLGLALPAGGLNAGTGFGIEAKGIIPMKKHPYIAFGIGVGYYWWGEKKISGYDNSRSNIPISATLMLFVSQNPIRLYFGSDFSMNFISITSESWFSGVKGSRTDQYFGFAPLFGIIAPIDDNTNIIGTMKYNLILIDETFNFLSLRVGLTF